MTHLPRAPRAALAAVILAVALSGCASDPSALEQPTAERLQTGVRAVATSAAAGDYTSAQSALGALQADLLAASAAGEVTGERSARIQSAINLVGADLNAAIEAAKPAPVLTQTPTPTPTKDSKPGKGNDEDDDDKKGNGKDD
ncbi:hypothetical protein E3T54_15890 [Cryobacterium sp. Sr8]|uniref:hypothetical protein n=1 Tax=Cryobacterium sp. Sr8 TaxID=1259203 RepID=UPI00106CEDA3|nr:hypothetical protein [Cryobacterium sp. Sr8]TFD74252.1 hypothetical protein E3T54_15890 [Cryobacterium sp. Sr8]